MLSQTAEHALRALLYLARTGDDEPVSAAHIASAIGAPYRYLAKTLATLAAAGLVQAVRGRVGGYRLAVPADGIAVSELMALFPSSNRGARCLLGDRDCDTKAPCSAHLVWKRAQDQALAHMRTLRISDLAAAPDGSNEPISYNR